MLRWWKSEVNRSFFRCLAACRMRCSACDTLTRSCARRVLCWLAFPLAPALRSPDRRFVDALANGNARLGADVVRYSFIVSDFHRLLLAGLPAHFESDHASRAVALCSP